MSILIDDRFSGGLPLEFRVLGPLEVRAGGSVVPVRGWREQAVLAILLLADGGTVTLDRLVEAVWDDDPPDGSVKAVRNCVSALRRRVADGDVAGAGTVIPIRATLAGYQLPLDGAWLDASEFQQQADAATRLAAAGQAGEAAAGLRAALALWRGPALAGTASRIVQDYAARLDELRVSALEDCLDLELALGGHRHAVAELRSLASEHPLRERIAGQLMLALYRSGRQAEALDVYLRLARRLAGDLGLDPAAATTRLQESILRQDPSLDLPPGRQPAGLRQAGTRCRRARARRGAGARLCRYATANAQYGQTG